MFLDDVISLILPLAETRFERVSTSDEGSVSGFVEEEKTFLTLDNIFDSMLGFGILGALIGIVGRGRGRGQEREDEGVIVESSTNGGALGDRRGYRREDEGVIVESSTNGGALGDRRELKREDEGVIVESSTNGGALGDRRGYRRGWELEDNSEGINKEFLEPETSRAMSNAVFFLEGFLVSHSTHPSSTLLCVGILATTFLTPPPFLIFKTLALRFEMFVFLRMLFNFPSRRCGGSLRFSVLSSRDSGFGS